MTVKLSISITEGPEKGMSFEFQSGSILVGRGRGEIPLTDKKISGKHCQFHIENDRVWLEDLNSTNGTFLGSSRLTERVALSNLDVVTVGLTRLSIAIVENLEDFKSRNQSAIQDSSATVSELDEASSEGEPIVESNLDFFEDNPSSPEMAENTPQASPEESEESGWAQESGETPEQGLEAELEIDQARPVSSDQKNSPSEERQNLDAIELPSEDARYRETGVQRIEDLIDDEIQSFSKWDHPAMKDSSSPSSGAMPKIDVRIIRRKGPANFQELKCQQKAMSFGRKDVDVRINDLDLSRKHASVELVNGEKVFVRDLASTNGTFVNGQRISHHELKNGDLIQIGQNIFEVVIREDE